MEEALDAHCRRVRVEPLASLLLGVPLPRGDRVVLSMVPQAEGTIWVLYTESKLVREEPVSERKLTETRAHRLVVALSVRGGRAVTR